MPLARLAFDGNIEQSYCLLNSSTRVVLPTWRAPRRTSGLRFPHLLHYVKSSINCLYIMIVTTLFHFTKIRIISQNIGNTRQKLSQNIGKTVIFLT